MDMDRAQVMPVGNGAKDFDMARVLIAEDDAAVREFVRRALTHGGHDVHTAHDGIDALHI